MIALETGTKDNRMVDAFGSPFSPIMNWVVTSDVADEYCQSSDLNWPLSKRNVNQFTIGIRRVVKYNAAYGNTWFNHVHVKDFSKTIKSFQTYTQQFEQETGLDDLRDPSINLSYIESISHNYSDLSEKLSTLEEAKKKLLVLQPGIYLVDKTSIKPVQDELLKNKIIDKALYDKTMSAFDKVVIPIFVTDTTSEPDGSGITTFIGSELIPLYEQQNIPALKATTSPVGAEYNKYKDTYKITSDKLIELPIYFNDNLGSLIKGVDLGVVTFPSVMVPYASETNFNAEQFNTFYKRLNCVTYLVNREMSKYKTSNLLTDLQVTFRPQITLMDQYIDWVNKKHSSIVVQATTNVVDAITAYEYIGSVFHNYVLSDKTIIPSIDIFGIIARSQGGNNPKLWKSFDNNSFVMKAHGDGKYVKITLDIKGKKSVNFSYEDNHVFSIECGVAYLYFCEYMNTLRNSVDAMLTMSSNFDIGSCRYAENTPITTSTYLPIGPIKCEELGAYSINCDPVNLYLILGA